MPSLEHDTILLVSDPPHEEVDVEALADVLELDVFATRLKANFAAPEIVAATDPVEAAELLKALSGAGFAASAVPWNELTTLPWPNPASSLVFDGSCLRATTPEGTVEVAYDVEVFGVYCKPPEGFSPDRAVDLDRSVASAHGPTIAESIQWISNLDLYHVEEGSLRRLSIVPEILDLDEAFLLSQMSRRFTALRLDRRLEDVFPRGRYLASADRGSSTSRRGYSFGTRRLWDLLGMLSQELRGMPQFELGTRLAYLLAPLE